MAVAIVRAHADVIVADGPVPPLRAARAATITVALVVVAAPRGARVRLHYRMRARFRFRPYPAAGGLISYGIDSLAARRQAAAYVAKIRRGANPADLRVEGVDKFELVINMKPAQALGLSVPKS